MIRTDAITIVNSTKADLRPFHSALVAAVLSGTLPEYLADMFQMEVVRYSDSDVRAIITWA